ncbi:MFS transporter [Massilia putida]|uniref:MFS transporter n=1 Tax=Massilia putida TaxID=1141883 RepID=UPI000950C6AC|nr:MFS transporter [Massilia putida]
MTDDAGKDERWKCIMGVLVVAETASAFESSMTFAALPTFYKLFHDPANVGWVITAYLLVAAAATAICGRLGDIYGRSRVLLALLVLATAGSLTSAMANTLEGVIWGRAVQGVAAAVLPLCYGLIRERMPQLKVAWCIGVIAGTASVAAGAGFMLAGLMIDFFTWHWIFYISTAVAAASVVLVALCLPPSPRRAAGARVDIIGGLLFAPAIAGLLLAVTKGQGWGWADGRAWTLLGSSALLLVFWARYELRHPNPLIDVRLFGHRQIALTNAGHALLGLGAMQLAQVLFVLLQQPAWTGVGLGVGATVAALVKLPSALVAAVAAPWGGTLAGRSGARRAMLAGSGILTAGWAALALYHGTVWMVALGTVVTGFGIAVAFSAIINLIVEVAPPARTSELTGLTQVVRVVSMAIGAQLITVALASSTVVNPALGPGRYPDAPAFQLAFYLITGLSALAFLAALLLPARGSMAPQASASTRLQP